MGSRDFWVIPREENASHDVTIHGVHENGISVLGHRRNPQVPLEGFAPPSGSPVLELFHGAGQQASVPPGAGCGVVHGRAACRSPIGIV